MTGNLDELMNRYSRFIEERDWTKFHKPKNISMAIAVEAGELMELFQWHDSLPPNEIKSDRELIADVEDELADVLIYCMSMAIHLDIDLEEIIEVKLAQDEARFDPDRSKDIREDLENWQQGFESSGEP